MVDTSEAITVIRVKVSETNGFFETIPPADLQQITLSNLDNPLPDAFVLTEETPGSGIYSESILTEALLQDRWLLQIDFEAFGKDLFESVICNDRVCKEIFE